MTQNPYASPELQSPTPLNRAQRIRRFGYWIAAGMITVAVLGLLVPLATVAVWDGRFDLTIHVDSDPEIDLESVRFVPCWKQSDATYFLSQADERFGGTWSTTSGDVANKNWTIDVQCSGRHHWAGIGDTYVEQRFLVAEYESTASGECAKYRKQLLIPQGRGPRSMTIELP